MRVAFFREHSIHFYPFPKPKLSGNCVRIELAISFGNSELILRCHFTGLTCVSFGVFFKFTAICVRFSLFFISNKILHKKNADPFWSMK